MMHFYAQKKAVKAGQAQTPANYSYTTRNGAEKQFYLLCASAISNADEVDMISVEYGTIEQGAIDRRYWDFTPAPNED